MSIVPRTSAGPTDPLSTTDDRISYYEGGQAVLLAGEGTRAIFALASTPSASRTRASFAVTSTDGSVTPFRQSVAPGGKWMRHSWMTVEGHAMVDAERRPALHAISRAASASTHGTRASARRSRCRDSAGCCAAPIPAITRRRHSIRCRGRCSHSRRRRTRLPAAARRARRAIRCRRRRSRIGDGGVVRQFRTRRATSSTTTLSATPTVLPADYRSRAHPWLGGERPLAASLCIIACASHLLQPAGGRVLAR